MKKRIGFLVTLLAITGTFRAAAYNGIWQNVDAAHVPSKDGPVMHPLKYYVYSLNTAYLRDVLFSLTEDPASAAVVELPLPDGAFREFRVWQSPMMESGLAAKYPNIRTFSAEAVNDKRVVARLDFTEYGFHAMILDGDRTSFIDPYNRLNDGFYMCHYKRDEYRPANERMACELSNPGDNEIAPVASVELGNNPLPPLAKIASGYQLHTYRLALACSHQYAVAATGNATPTKAQVFSCMTTSMNRINGVYEKELSIHMNFVNNDDTLIYTTAAGDPYSADNANPGNLLDDNQMMCDSLIGTPNYDFGHVFTTAGGGLSALGCICNAGNKANSETGGSNPVGDGFDIDYVAHEMGHAYGANHTFNNGANGSCSNNSHKNTAYEPGSATTIMGYAGICSPDDIQPHSDAYFHAASLREIYNYSISIAGGGYACAVLTPTNNKPVGTAPFAATYSIPYKTPFELSAPTAVDSVADTLTTYCWEQWNLGDWKKAFNNTYVNGPIFRSFNPTETTLRVFPVIDSVLRGTLSYVTVENSKGEKVPDTARFLTFKLTIRDIYNGNGCFLFPDDTIHLNAVSTGAANNYKGFAVTSPSTAVNWPGGSTQTITWDVVGTDAVPVSCDSVDIYLSTDGGHNWQIPLGRYANNGSANVTLLNPPTNITTARIKVKGAGNVFFNVNGSNFTIQHTTGVASVLLADNTNVYPVPSGDLVHVSTSLTGTLQASVYNALGQLVMNNSFSRQMDIAVASWAKGVYFLHLTNPVSGARTVKQIIVK